MKIQVGIQNIGGYTKYRRLVKIQAHDRTMAGVKIYTCAAKAFYYCPAIINHRPRSQNILKEQALNPEKDSRIKRPRSQVSLEKSSQNYKPLEYWAKPNLPPDVTPHPSYCLGECIWRVCHVVKPEATRISCHSQQPKKVAKDRGEGGVNRGLI